MVALNDSLPNQPIGPNSIIGSRLFVIGAETDGGLPIPAAQFDYPDGTYTLVRGAAGQLYVAKASAADTTHPHINLSSVLGHMKLGVAGGSLDPSLLPRPGAPGGGQPHQIRGAQITGFDLYYTVGTASLTSMTPLVWRSAFTENAAVPTPSNPAGALTPSIFPVAFRANMYVRTIAFATPFMVNNNVGDTEDAIEITVVDPGTAVLHLYGAFLRFNYCLM